MKGWAKGVGGAVAGAFAIGAVAAFGKGAVDAALESEVATNRLKAVFSAMGDTTGKAAAEAEKFASALSRKTGIDDENIMSAQALLATFGKVSSETGRQAGIYDRATAAAADLSKAGFGDLDSSAKQLGKALQDPLKGISALGKAGVTFTADQKKQIAAIQVGQRPIRVRHANDHRLRIRDVGKGAGDVLAGDKSWRDVVVDLRDFGVPTYDTKTTTFWVKFYPQDPPGLTTKGLKRRDPGVYNRIEDDWWGIPSHEQDTVAQESQGPIFDRSREHLGVSDRGLIMMREIMTDCIEGIKRGKDPVGVIRDFSKNEIITFDASMAEIDALG
jgi:hypothetical protein